MNIYSDKRSRWLFTNLFSSQELPLRSETFIFSFIQIWNVGAFFYNKQMLLFWCRKKPTPKAPPDPGPPNLSASLTSIPHPNPRPAPRVFTHVCCDSGFPLPTVHRLNSNPNALPASSPPWHCRSVFQSHEKLKNTLQRVQEISWDFMKNLHVWMYVHFSRESTDKFN